MWISRAEYVSLLKEVEFLRGRMEESKLYVDHLKSLVAYERNRVDPPNLKAAVEVSRSPTPPESRPLPEKVAKAVLVAARPGTDAHERIVDAAHNALLNQVDEDALIKEISLGERSFDDLLHMG